MRRILLISNLYAPDEIGGYEILARLVANELRSRGHEVSILCARGQTKAAMDAGISRSLELSAPFTRSDDRSIKRATLLYRNNHAATRAAIRSTRADAVLLFSQRRLGLGPLQAVRESGLSALCVVNDAWPLSYRQGRSRRSLARAAGALANVKLTIDASSIQGARVSSVVLSESLRRELCDAGLALGSVPVVRQGVSTELFNPRGDGVRDDATFRLLYAGQLHRYKGVHRLLEALSCLERNGEAGGVTLSIAGTGAPEYETKLRDAARTLRTPVEFLGKVAFEKMPQVYRDHDALIFPSLWNEPMGLTHLEAMASGLPTVVAFSGGCRELIERCPHILGYPPDEPAALARCIQFLVSDRRRARTLGGASRRWVETHASMRGYVTRLASLIPGTTGSNARRSELRGHRNEVYST